MGGAPARGARFVLPLAPCCCRVDGDLLVGVALAELAGTRNCDCRFVADVSAGLAGSLDTRRGKYGATGRTSAFVDFSARVDDAVVIEPVVQTGDNHLDP